MRDPLGVSCLLNGDIVVTEWGNKRLQIFDIVGKPVACIGKGTIGPQGVAITLKVSSEFSIQFPFIIQFPLYQLSCLINLKQPGYLNYIILSLLSFKSSFMMPGKYHDYGRPEQKSRDLHPNRQFSHQMGFGKVFWPMWYSCLSKF